MAERRLNAFSLQHDSLDDTDAEAEESLWESPAKPVQSQKSKMSAGTSSQVSGTTAKYEDPETKDESLRQELAKVRKVNEAIEGLIESLERAQSNMKTVNQTVGAASSLLNTWTRILSQTEHNQRLILDPSWQGASQDMADLEADTVARKQASLRREAEEQERRSAAAKRAEEEEQRRAVDTTKTPKSLTRGRGRGTGRATSAQSAYVPMGGSANNSSISSSRGSSTTRRTTSGLTRGRGSRARV